MFCTTTTPFQIQDAVAIIGKPIALVLDAWEALEPQFGAQIVFGCGRTEPVANFYDVVAMGALIVFLSSAVEEKQATAIAIEIAEEVSLSLDQIDNDDPFGSRPQQAVLSSIERLVCQDFLFATSLQHQDFASEIGFEVMRIMTTIREGLKEVQMGQGREASFSNLAAGDGATALFESPRAPCDEATQYGFVFSACPIGTGFSPNEECASGTRGVDPVAKTAGSR